MQALRQIADRLIGLSATVGALALFVLVGVILADVAGRAFGQPVFGSQDMVTMAMVIVVFGGMALCDRIGGHVAVDIFEPSYPAWLNRWVDIASALLGAVVFAAIAYAVVESAKLSLMLNLSTNLLNLPKAWFQWALSGLSLLTAAGLLLRAAELALTGRDVRREGQAALPHTGGIA